MVVSKYCLLMFDWLKGPVELIPQFLDFLDPFRSVLWSPERPLFYACRPFTLNDSSTSKLVKTRTAALQTKRQGRIEIPESKILGAPKRGNHEHTQPPPDVSIGPCRFIVLSNELSSFHFASIPSKGNNNVR